MRNHVFVFSRLPQNGDYFIGHRTVITIQLSATSTTSLKTQGPRLPTLRAEPIAPISNIYIQK